MEYGGVEWIGTDTLKSLTNLLWYNEIYTCAVCGGSSGSPFDETEAFVFKREVPGFSCGYAERFAYSKT
jgi:V8-like Glu-specific endopeptidase